MVRFRAATRRLGVSAAAKFFCCLWVVAVLPPVDAVALDDVIVLDVVVLDVVALDVVVLAEGGGREDGMRAVADVPAFEAGPLVFLLLGARLGMALLGVRADTPSSPVEESGAAVFFFSMESLMC